MAGLLVLFILVTSPQEIVVARTLQPALSCVQAVLILDSPPLHRYT